MTKICRYLWRILPNSLRVPFFARGYVASLEGSLTSATKFAATHPNSDELWTKVRRTVEDFLLNEWRGGALIGNSAEQAYYVRCDRTTMTQNDIDNGRLICVVGVAPLKPAEFVIFRIGQWTAVQPDP